MTYGILASGSCLLTDIVDSLHEDSRKVNSVERLTRHLDRGTPVKALSAYLSVVRKWCPDEPVIYIDDSDIVKPDSYKFEALGIVRDGSRSTDTKNVYEKGYHVTEACVMTQSQHPVSIFSKIHFSKENAMIEEYFRCQDVPLRKFPDTETCSNECIKFLHYLMHGISAITG